MEEEKIEELKPSNENNRKISGPFGNPANWFTSSSSSSSSTTSVV